MVILSTMTSSDVGALMGAVQWAEEGMYIKEIVARKGLPKLAKVIKGQYLNVGVPVLANPSLASTLLLLPGGNPIRVSAQSVKFKEGRKVIPVGPKLAIPESYDGYFEILNEDGRAVRCIESVSELAKRFPDSCLVRENIKAFVSRSDDVDIIMEKSRLVQVGETLVLVGEVMNSKSGKPQQRFLRCFDQSGQNVYLPYESKGKFSAIAKEDNISGAHNIRNLLTKRLPLMVRLIHGHTPVGPKSTQFLPELRLYSSFTEEPVIALPLGKDSPLVFLPPSVPLKLTLAKNSENIEKSKEFLRLCDRASVLLQDMCEKIYVYENNTGSKNSNGTKDPRFFHLPEKIKSYSKHSQYHHPKVHRLKSPPDKNVKEKDKSNKVDDYDEIDEIYDYVRGFVPFPKPVKSIIYESNSIPRKVPPPTKVLDSKENRPVPPPIETIPSRRSCSNIPDKLSSSLHPALISAVLEKAERNTDTLSKKIEHEEKKFDKFEKVKNEKRSKNLDVKNYNSEKSSTITLNNIRNSSKSSPESKGGGNKLFIKSCNQKSSKSKIFRHKSSSPVKETALDIVSSSPTGGITPSLSSSHISGQNGFVSGSTATPSPLFKLRYKSLTNLAMDFDTLDSSTSGGKNSTDSYGSTAFRKMPEKRSRKLPRPKSLTNLVWDSRGVLPLIPGISQNRSFVDAERKLRLEPGVYRHSRDAPALLAATTKMLASQKKIGTLYL